jgi:hypothetical protein
LKKCIKGADIIYVMGYKYMTEHKLSKWCAENGLSELNSEGMRLSEDIIGIAVPAFSYAETAISVAKSIEKIFDLGIFGKEPSDPIAELQANVNNILQKLDEGFAQVLGAIRVADESERFRDIDDLITPMRNAIIDLKSFSPDDPRFNSDRFHVDCTKAVGSLNMDAAGAEGYWYRYFYKGYEGYGDEWSGPLDPTLKGEKVFDYRFILPLYLESLTSLLLVAFALCPLTPSSVKEEYNTYFKEAADSLLKIHEMIRESIVAIRRPESYELIGYWINTYNYDSDGDISGLRDSRYDQNHNSEYWYGGRLNWNGYNRIYGVVEKYSGDHILENYQIDLSPPPNFPFSGFEGSIVEGSVEGEILKEWHENFAEFYNRDFCPRYAIRTLILWKQLYAKIGLPSVWHTMNQLKGLIGEPILNEFDYSCWSLREISGIVWNELNKNSANEKPKEISLRQLAIALGMTDQISLRQIFEG